MKTVLIATLSVLAPIVASQAFADNTWSVTGNVADSCSGTAACPGMTDSQQANGVCEGNALLEIEKGHYGETTLDALDVVISYRLGDWVRVYVDDTATDGQITAVKNLLKQGAILGNMFAGNAKTLSVERAEVNVTRKPTSIEFSVPESKTEMEMLPGEDGEPIRVQNATDSLFQDGYVRYETAVLSHKRGMEDFYYSGTSGAIGHIDTSGTVPAS